MPKPNEMICVVCEGTWKEPLRIGKKRMPFPVEWKLCKADCHNEAKWKALTELHDGLLAARETRIAELEKALTRLGSSEPFTHPHMAQEYKNAELLSRMEFASKVLAIVDVDIASGEVVPK